MSDTDHDHHFTRVIEQALNSLRCRENETTAFRELHEVCMRWINRYGSSLVEGDREDAVCDAITAVYSLIDSPDVSIEEVRKRLVRKLNSNRAAAKSKARRHVEYQDFQHQRLDFNDGEEVMALEDLKKVVASTFELAALAIDLLSNRYHDIVVAEYDLGALGFVIRDKGSLSFSSDSARRTALYRARKQLGRNFDTVLQAALTGTTVAPDILEQARKWIRGEIVGDPLGALQEIREVM